MTAFYIVLIVIMVLLSAFFSGSEISFASSNKFRIKKAAEEGDKRAKVANYINEHYNESISTILVGNNLVNIIASSAATVLTLHWVLPNKDLWVTIIMTVIILIFGEIVPKSVCNEYADELAPAFAPPLRALLFIFYPVVWVVTKLVDRLALLWKPDEEEPAVTQEELYTALEEIEDEGVFTESESELIKSAIEFTDIMAHEILIPRVDVIAFDIDDGLEALLENEELLHYSRFPVYRETIDNVIGILSVKRLMKELIEKKAEEVDLESLLYTPVFVHKTMAISSIIKEFRRQHAQMAIVVDEYGGTMGILTMEDILEEIVGEIFDESDNTEEEAVMRSVNTFEVDGSMNIYDMFELVGYEPDDEFESEYNTAGGWATEELDRFPRPGDHFAFRNLSVEVLEAQSFRVDKLLVTVNPPE
ncbi:MAG: hemolysin family protein [Clostridia bacterium]|nr:hemolysin family protein [Clostridia bacterium]